MMPSTKNIGTARLMRGNSIRVKTKRTMLRLARYAECKKEVPVRSRAHGKYPSQTVSQSLTKPHIPDNQQIASKTAADENQQQMHTGLHQIP